MATIKKGVYKFKDVLTYPSGETSSFSCSIPLQFEIIDKNQVSESEIGTYELYHIEMTVALLAYNFGAYTGFSEEDITILFTSYSKYENDEVTEEDLKKCSNIFRKHFPNADLMKLAQTQTINCQSQRISVWGNDPELNNSGSHQMGVGYNDVVNKKMIPGVGDDIVNLVIASALITYNEVYQSHRGNERFWKRPQLQIIKVLADTEVQDDFGVWFKENTTNVAALDVKYNDFTLVRMLVGDAKLLEVKDFKMEDDLVFEIVEDNLISFTIDGTTYHAYSGMTWEEWVNSDYNTNEYSLYYTNGYYWIKNIDGYTVCINISGVTSNELIIDGQEYRLYMGPGSSN